MPYSFNPFTGTFETTGKNEDQIIPYVNTLVNDLRNGVATDLDTLQELAAAISGDPAFLSKVNADIQELRDDFESPVSGIVQSLIDAVGNEVDQVGNYLLDTAIATNGDIYVDHLTISSQATPTYTFGASVSGSLIP
jgi:hypothetical protein